MHTHHSDGQLAPRELLAAVRQQQVDHWAVTDHDSVRGWQALAAEPGLIPGVEITAGFAGREVHVVGLGIDPHHAELLTFLADIRALRLRRLTVLIARLPDDVKRGLTLQALCTDPLARDSESFGRLHLARSLLRRGGVSSISNAFEHHLGDEHTTDFDLEPYPLPSEVSAVIHAAGGVAILAHPGVYSTFAVIEPLMAQGLDGLEVNHPNLDPNLQATLLSTAVARNWLISAGSDLHFLGARKPGAWSMDERHRPLLDRLRVA